MYYNEKKNKSYYILNSQIFIFVIYVIYSNNYIYDCVEKQNKTKFRFNNKCELKLKLNKKVFNIDIYTNERKKI